ncbi:MAG: hypothetical protein ABI874_01055 [Chloroflexota bacterium]
MNKYIDGFIGVVIGAVVGVIVGYALIERVMAHVHAAASGVQAVLITVDGFAAYPKAILKYFYTPAPTGQRGRPRHVLWPDVHIAQVVKHRAGQTLRAIERRVVHRCRNRVNDMIVMSQSGFGVINSAFIEQLNATCRARMPALTRRTRNWAQTTDACGLKGFGRALSTTFARCIPTWRPHRQWLRV